MLLFFIYEAIGFALRAAEKDAVDGENYEYVQHIIERISHAYGNLSL